MQSILTLNVSVSKYYTTIPGGGGGVNNEARRRGVCISSTVHQP